MKSNIKAANNSQIKQVEQNLIPAKMKQDVNSEVVSVVTTQKQEVSGVNNQVQEAVNNNDVNSSNSSSNKGKRGRPKKVDLPIPTIPVSSNEEQQLQQQQQPQQQLLQDEA